jgi:hypothetical protein
VQVIFQGLLATRMQLDLWKLDHHAVTLPPDSDDRGLTNLEVFELTQRATSLPGGTA